MCNDTDPSDEPHRRPPLRRRFVPLLTAYSLVLFAALLVLLLRRSRIDLFILPLQQRIATLGAWGPLVFVLVYVLAVLLLLPGSVLTMAAGALFGLALGTATVSLSATLAAALGFLIARYLARERIVRRLQSSPRFAALDRAVAEGGWKIVALLRLSPAVPFNVQNYIYGLTGIRFWPYVLTSWLTMLPGTLLYVYLGHLGRVGVEAAGGERSRSPAEWTLLVVGLAATAAVTVYVTRLARKALRHYTIVGENRER